jgi:GNAT superfamily N-acetyltransferase
MPCVLERFTAEIAIVVRACEERDLAALEWHGAFTTHRSFMHEQFERQQRGESVMLVADHDGFPLGQIWIDLVQRAAESTAVLWALRVLEPVQSAGIGRRLLAAAERVAHDAGFEVAEIGVERDNPRARRWYERSGYACTRGEVTEQTYVAPDGTSSRHVFDQTILQKALRAAGKRS